MTEMGQWHALPRRSIAVRFTPVSGIDSRSQGLPGRAISGREQMQQIASSFDHLVGAHKQSGWHSKAERVRGLQVEDQLDFRGLENGEIAWFVAFWGSACVHTGLPRPLT